MRSGRPGWGLAVAILYAAALVASARLFGLPPRPVFDGLAPPPPYRYVNPPPELEELNEPPLDGAGTIDIGPDAGAATVATGDGQALVSVPRGAFRPPPGPGPAAVEVTITPLDPESLGPPPRDLRFDGNAYRVEATYAGSETPAEPTTPLTVFLRYPLHSDRLLRWSGTGWDRLTSNTILPSLQVWAETLELGDFVAAALDFATPPPPAGGPHWTTLALLAAVAALAAAVSGLMVRRRSSRGDT